MLYYVQGYHLAVFNVPLFEEEIEKWQYGPVVPDVYREFKRFGSYGIDVPAEIDNSVFDPRQLSLFDSAWAILGQYSALKLMDMTHNEAPYLDTNMGGIIPKNVLRDFFKNYITSE